MITFKDWSKINGKILYHGSNAEFDRFDPERLGRTDAGFMGTGFYLTEYLDVAERYAKNASDIHGGDPHVLKFKVNPKKVLLVDGPGAVDWSVAMRSINIGPDDMREQTKLLTQMGYDATVCLEDDAVKEFASFDPFNMKRIK